MRHIINADIRFRRRTKEDWLEDDPVIDDSEPVVEKDTGKLKIGDGTSRYSQLPYFAPVDSTEASGEVSDADLLAHINSLVPHPVYDDGPSLLLLYQNAKV